MDSFFHIYEIFWSSKFCRRNWNSWNQTVIAQSSVVHIWYSVSVSYDQLHQYGLLLLPCVCYCAFRDSFLHILVAGGGISVTVAFLSVYSNLAILFWHQQHIFTHRTAAYFLLFRLISVNIKGSCAGNHLLWNSGHSVWHQHPCPIQNHLIQPSSPFWWLVWISADRFAQIDIPNCTEFLPYDWLVRYLQLKRCT